MAFLYIVRCNFTAPDREEAWNTWYSGPKIAQMLAQPHFRSCQRFRLASGRGRNYLALWTVETPQALATPQYVSQWGFADWASFVTDWSRDLFDGQAAPADAFAVEAHGALHAVTFDRMSEAHANAARAAIARAEPDMVWLPGIGLDRHTPLIGLRRLPDARPAQASATLEDARIHSAIYRPICGHHIAPTRD
jgi:hypothetical protein